MALEDRRHEGASIEHEAAGHHWSGGIIGIFVRRLGAEGLWTWCKRDREIRFGQTMSYSGPNSAFSVLVRSPTDISGK
jgi:hypothetical protein